jgi:hypothetical protein
MLLFAFAGRDFAADGIKILVGIAAQGGGAVFLLDLQINLFAVYRNITWGGNSEADLVAAHFDHGNFNIVADFDTLVETSGQYEHGGPPWHGL